MNNIDRLLELQTLKQEGRSIIQSKLKDRYVIDGIRYTVKVTASTVTIRSNYDSFQFEFSYKVRFMNVVEGIEKYVHERMMKKRSTFGRNPLSSQKHRNSLIELVKDEVR